METRAAKEKSKDKYGEKTKSNSKGQTPSEMGKGIGAWTKKEILGKKEIRG